MKSPRPFLAPLLEAACLALLLAACSLAEDITPPPALATQAARPVPTAAPSQPMSAPAPPPLADAGTVTGLVANATVGGNVPPDQPVVLHIFDNLQETQTLTATIGADGTYTFPNVPLVMDRAFIVTVDYGSATYASDVVKVDGTQSEFTLPITIYDATTDASTILIDRLHVFFQFEAEQVQVGELYIISNTGDKVVTGLGPGGPVLVFFLPEGAENPTFQDGELGDRYQKIPLGFADTSVVRPGQQSHQVLVSFTLPYRNSLDFEQAVRYPTAAVNVLLPDNRVSLTSSQLQDQGLRQVQDSSFRNFVGGGLQPDDALVLSLSGKPEASAASGTDATGATTSGSSTQLLFGAGALALALAGVGVWWMRRGTKEEKEEEELPEDVEGIIRAIAALDDDFAAGKVNEADYRARRARLKQRALEAMKESEAAR